ncbi:MAG TPA: hypothetical protein PLB62_09635 [Candidatus Sumerlaeota bacterium]|nr:hypothetical protein [Candidatus Sumerlaeota bacterium]
MRDTINNNSKQALEQKSTEDLRFSGDYIPFSTGDILFWKGNMISGVYLIVEGEVDCINHHKQQHETLLATYGRGARLTRCSSGSWCPLSATIIGRTGGALLRLNEDNNF